MLLMDNVHIDQSLIIDFNNPYINCFDFQLIL